MLIVMVTVAVSSDGSGKIKMMGNVKFEDLSEEKKQKIKHIEKEFGDEGTIHIGDEKRRSITIMFGKKNKNKLCESYVNAVKNNKVNDDDSNSVKKEIEVYEKNGLKLLEKAGYPTGTKFSLKLAAESFNTKGKMSKKNMLKEGLLTFDEYYDGIRIVGGYSAMYFVREHVFSIKVDAVANLEGVSIASSIPKILFSVALRTYLSTSKKLNLDERPRGSLCYILNENKSLILCWVFNIWAGSDSKVVYVNAETGKTEREVSTVYH